MSTKCADYILAGISISKQKPGMKVVFTFAIIIFSNLWAYSQQEGMGVGTLSPNEYSILDASSNEKGMLVPRLSNNEAANLQLLIESGSVSANSLLIFNTDSLWFQFWKNDSWIPLISGDTDSDEQNLTGASLTNAQLQIDIENGNSASVDLSPLVDHDFHDAITNAPSTDINNSIYTNGKVGIGNNTPINQLHVTSLDGNDAVRIDGLQDGNLNHDIVVTNNSGELKKVDSENYIRSVCPFTPPAFFGHFMMTSTESGNETGDYDGNGPLITGSVSLEYNSTQIWFDINISAIESVNDGTVAEIDTDYYVYEVPDGWQIVSLFYGSTTSITFTDCDHVEDFYVFGASKLVRNWTFMGDTSGSDVAYSTSSLACTVQSWSRIVFNSMTVVIEPE